MNQGHAEVTEGAHLGLGQKTCFNAFTQQYCLVLQHHQQQKACSPSTWKHCNEYYNIIYIGELYNLWNMHRLDDN